MLTSHATVLLVPDVPAAVDYYRDKLGFEVSTYDANPEHYGYARRDSCYLHFACLGSVEPRPNHPDIFDIYVYTDDVDALYEELVGRGADVLDPPADRPFGLRDFRVRDPFGHELAFGQFLD